MHPSQKDQDRWLARATEKQKKEAAHLLSAIMAEGITSTPMFGDTQAMAKKLNVKPPKKSAPKKSPTAKKMAKAAESNLYLAGEAELAFAKVWLALLDKLTPETRKLVDAFGKRTNTAPEALLLAALGLVAVMETDHQKRKVVAPGALPRHAKISSDLARKYAPLILQVLVPAVADDHQWIRVDTNPSARTVQSYAEHPGTAPKVILLDIREHKRDEWKDTAGNFTLDSVVANLLGYARPTPPPPTQGPTISPTVANGTL